MVTPPEHELHIPSEFQSFLLSIATNIRYQNTSFGSLLSQECNMPTLKVFVYHFFANRDAVFHTSLKKPTIAFHFMIKGHIRFSLRNQDVHFPSDHFGLFFLPGDEYELAITKGTSTYIQFEPGDDYAYDLAAMHPSFKDMQQQFFNGPNAIRNLPLMPVTYPIQYHLNRLYALKKDDHGIHHELRVTVIVLMNIYRKELRSVEELQKAPFTPHKEYILQLGETIRRQPNIRDYTIRRLITESRLTEYSLRHEFELVWKKSLKKFVIDQCMEKALFLITETSMSFEEIADMLGYENASNFRRTFKIYTGKNLKQMRSGHRD